MLRSPPATSGPSRSCKPGTTQSARPGGRGSARAARRVRPCCRHPPRLCPAPSLCRGPNAAPPAAAPVPASAAAHRHRLDAGHVGAQGGGVHHRHARVQPRQLWYRTQDTGYRIVGGGHRGAGRGQQQQAVHGALQPAASRHRLQYRAMSCALCGAHLAQRRGALGWRQLEGLGHLAGAGGLAAWAHSRMASGQAPPSQAESGCRRCQPGIALPAPTACAAAFRAAVGSQR